jgi:hypothetical protein
MFQLAVERWAATGTPSSPQKKIAESGVIFFVSGTLTAKGVTPLTKKKNCQL